MITTIVSGGLRAVIGGLATTGAGNRATVKIIEGINHMGIVGEPAAVSVIADDVATTALMS